MVQLGCISGEHSFASMSMKWLAITPNTPTSLLSALNAQARTAQRSFNRIIRTGVQLDKPIALIISKMELRVKKVARQYGATSNVK